MQAAKQAVREAKTTVRAFVIVVAGAEATGSLNAFIEDGHARTRSAIAYVDTAIRSHGTAAAKETWAKSDVKDTDEGSVQILIEPKPAQQLTTEEVDQVQDALLKPLPKSSWSLQRPVSVMTRSDVSTAELKCSSYQYDYKKMAEKIPELIARNPFIDSKSATQKALAIFSRKYGKGVPPDVQIIYILTFDDGEVFVTDLPHPEVKPYSAEL